jgi:NMD protein affecting ribosome stability and mRNA decay
MATTWTCPKCDQRTGGPAANYGSTCDECNGTNARKRAEAERWAALTLEQKVEELKTRLDAMAPAIQQAWLHVPIG